MSKHADRYAGESDPLCPEIVEELCQNQNVVRRMPNDLNRKRAEQAVGGLEVMLEHCRHLSSKNTSEAFVLEKLIESLSESLEQCREFVRLRCRNGIKTRM